MNTDIKNIQNEELKMIREIERIAKLNNFVYYLAYGSVIGAVREKGFIEWDTDIDIAVKYDDYRNFCDILSKEINEDYIVNTYWNDSNYDSLKSRVSIKKKDHSITHIDIFPVSGIMNNKLAKLILPRITFLFYRIYFYKKVNINIKYNKNKGGRIRAYIYKILFSVIPSKVVVTIHEKIAKCVPVKESDFVFNTCGSYGYKEIIPKEFLGEPELMMFEEESLPIPSMWHEYLTHFYSDYMTPKKDNYI